MKIRLLLAAILTAAPALALAATNTGYSTFDLRPDELDEGVPKSNGTRAVASKVSSVMDSRCGPRLAQWNSTSPRSGQIAGLLIEPHITRLHFVSGNARFWLGVFKGNSDIFTTVKILDAATHTQLAEQSFRGHGNGFKGTVTIGATDNRMLSTVAIEMCDYIIGAISPSAATSAVYSAGTAVSSGQKSPDLYEEILKLDDLRKRGLLTDEEFEAQKRNVLARDDEEAKDPKL
jgi:hypothetical protein